MTAISMGFDWNDQGTDFRLDVMSLTLALALHLPLYFMKFNASKKVVDHPTDRLVEVNLIDPTVLAPPAAPPPLVKESSLMQRLKLLVHREPPPPPPPPKVVKAPEQLNTATPQIKIQPNLKLPEVVQPKLETKSGFKTNLDAKLVEEAQIKLKTIGAGSAPLSERKLGTIADRGNLKNDKGNFKIASNDSLKSIGGNEAGLSAGSAPTIAINAGSRGSSERFSAPPPQKADKGRMGAVGAVADLGGPQLGFKDSIIARDAKPGQIAIASSRGISGGVPGGVDGGVLGGKKDAGRFQAGGQPGGVIGGTGTGSVANAGTARAITSIAHPVQKKSMFTITGPLKDRAIVSQVTPDYPAWAQAQGLEASVVLEFTVLADGSVKEDIVVRRTTGYPQLDQVAIKALRRWKFVPLLEDQVQVGQITFNFSLS